MNDRPEQPPNAEEPLAAHLRHEAESRHRRFKLGCGLTLVSAVALMVLVMRVGISSCAGPANTIESWLARGGLLAFLVGLCLLLYSVIGAVFDRLSTRA